MILKPTTAKLAVPCNQCGQRVEIKNNMAFNLIVARRKGITCRDCHGSPKWTKDNYHIYLESEHWQSFRLKALNHYGRKCYLCNATDVQIDLHHNTYERLGREEMSDVIPLCHPHHEQYERANK